MAATAVARAAPPVGQPDIADSARTPPNQSLYLQNLAEKLQKDDLKRALYMLFSTYGAVLDVVALKTSKMRGQAHVLFRDVQSATQAMRSCQGMEFFGREMRISYSRNQSDTLAKLIGVSPKTVAAIESNKQSAISSFPAPPGLPSSGMLPGPPPSLPPPPGLPAKPAAPSTAALTVPDVTMEEAASPQGSKRKRDEKDEEDEEHSESSSEEEE